jgi:predicted  nucleic acid-binding Zn-ribbon protein
VRLYILLLIMCSPVLADELDVQPSKAQFFKLPSQLRIGPQKVDDGYALPTRLNKEPTDKQSKQFVEPLDFTKWRGYSFRFDDSTSTAAKNNEVEGGADRPDMNSFLRATKYGMFQADYSEAVRRLKAASSVLQSPASSDSRYPEGQRGNFYADNNIEAIKEWRAKTSGGPSYDPKSRTYNSGNHVTTDEGKLHRDAEVALLDRQIEHLEKNMASDKGVIDRFGDFLFGDKRRLDNELAELQDKKRKRDELDKECRSKMSELDQTNYTCDDRLSYRECNCEHGRLAKNRQYSNVNFAIDRFNVQVTNVREAVNKYNENVNRYNADLARNQARRDSYNKDVVTSKDLRRRRDALKSAKTANSRPSGKIVYDESAPAQGR